MSSVSCPLSLHWSVCFRLSIIAVRVDGFGTSWESCEEVGRRLEVSCFELSPPHAFYSFRSFMQWIYLLNRHEKEVHGESRDFSCPEPDCNQSFKSKKNLTLHRNTHKTIKPFQCMWCDFTGRFIWNPGWFIPCSCLKVFWVWFWPVCFCGGMKMRIWDAMRVSEVGMWKRSILVPLPPLPLPLPFCSTNTSSYPILQNGSGQSLPYP